MASKKLKKSTLMRIDISLEKLIEDTAKINHFSKVRASKEIADFQILQKFKEKNLKLTRDIKF